MKRIISLQGMLLLVVLTTQAQGNGKVEKNVWFDIAVNEFVTGSGFAPGTDLFLRINEDNRRTLALGMYYCPEFNSILGITIKHEVFLLRKKQNRIEPYMFYNFIWRRNRISEHYTGMGEGLLEGTYKSLEHYLGLGLQMKLAKGIYLSGGAGLGAYFGSIEKPVLNPVMMNLSGGSGLSMVARIGVGFNLF